MYNNNKENNLIENLENIEKLEQKLKEYKYDEELIILIESGSLAPPHKMHIALMEMTKKFIEENYNNRKVVAGYLIPSSDNYVK